MSRNQEKPKKNINILLLSIFLLLLAAVLFIGNFTAAGRMLLSGESQEARANSLINRPDVVRTNESETENVELPEELPEASVEDLPEEDPQQEIIETPEQVQNNTETYQARLYFIKVNDQGQILMKSSLRTIPKKESILTETINALLLGPAADEINKNIISVIPPQSQLLSVRIENRVAYLNFNEPFCYNMMGLEGSIAQLKQLVFTATEFQTIDRVQFLINGQIKEYLNGEGVFIKEPLSREDFA